MKERIAWRTAMDKRTGKVVNLVLEVDTRVLLDVYGDIALRNKSGCSRLANGAIVIRKEGA